MMLPSIPTSAEVLAESEPGWGKTTVALAQAVGQLNHNATRVELGRFDVHDEDGTIPEPAWSIEFRKCGGCDASIHPSEVPQLIDVLTKFHRAWLELDPEAPRDHH